MRWDINFAALEFMEAAFASRLELVRGNSSHSLARFVRDRPDVKCDALPVLPKKKGRVPGMDDVA